MYNETFIIATVSVNSFDDDHHTIYKVVETYHKTNPILSIVVFSADLIVVEIMMIV